MTQLDLSTFQTLAAEANRAPSVHNTQPARFAMDETGRLLVLADLSRHLAVGDPTGRDMGLSCGTALEGMVMALANRGLGASVEDCWAQDLEVRAGYRLAARLTLGGEAKASDLSAYAEKRFTWRGAFSPTTAEIRMALDGWVAQQDDVISASGPEALSFVATLNDETSLGIMRDRAFRDELVSWMRLSPGHPNYATDGPNLEALHMDRLEGALAGKVLASPLFDIADRLRLGKAMVSEAAKTLSATACLLFHRPFDESPVTTGRAFYRFWLGFSRLRLAGWPMASLADMPEAAEAMGQRFAVPSGHRLINVLRVGPTPAGMAKYRLPAPELVLMD
ncbi:hypothetical protein ACSV9I_15865 [Rhizobium sp. G187]|uniref:hypothetical protein n=1 Tax=Rhizobium sp. G187 TaxID=3451352 RepID=UPI003EE4B337